jgi:hypothetical protein
MQQTIRTEQVSGLEERNEAWFIIVPPGLSLLHGTETGNTKSKGHGLYPNILALMRQWGSLFSGPSKSYYLHRPVDEASKTRLPIL